MFTYPYPRPAVTVDALVFRIKTGVPQVLLIKRGNSPFEGMWAAPGGFINMDETPETAVNRELEEETGLKGVQLFQFHTYGAIDRDPRHRTISIAFAGIMKNDECTVKGGDDASEAVWFPLNNLPPLAFDHSEIVADAIKSGVEKGWFRI